MAVRQSGPHRPHGAASAGPSQGRRQGHGVRRAGRCPDPAAPPAGRRRAVHRRGGVSARWRRVRTALAAPCQQRHARPPDGRNPHAVRNPRGRPIVVSRHFREGRRLQPGLGRSARLHPIGRWYHVAQTFDGTTYRSYVNGVLEGQARVSFAPQQPGSTSVAMRRNGVNHFHGAIAVARFTDEALLPRDFLSLPRGGR
ncbi:LamG-like jellyroll fold domain-containing protein [Novosphingobium rhizosphaerae]|uniref:LamG-like jellyroll fold domain-containing protein n=1 Tax=Novosphingobium rhizosphaerae TaxID=1551649 RepID=UPI003D812854